MSGTRGYIVVKLKRKYYIIYNHFDSYPEDLGIKVVDVVKDNISENKSGIDFLNNIKSKFTGQVTITIDPKEIQNCIFIEWVYIIDLDNSKFKITGGFYVPEYNLNDIPKDWLKEFQEKNESIHKKSI